MARFAVATLLTLRFLRALIVSGLQTVRIIAGASRVSGSPPPSGFVRMGFAPMGARGAALLGNMVSLTPGTTTIDIDMERRELLLHVLDASEPERLVAGIRRDFETGIAALFGGETP